MWWAKTRFSAFVLPSLSVSVMPYCPTWPDTVPDRANQEFTKQVAAVQARACGDIRAGVLRAGHLEDWHERMFRRWVPLEYYAGNFRQRHKLKPCLEQNVSVGGTEGSDFKQVHRNIQAMLTELRDDLAVLDPAALSPDEYLFELATTIAEAVGKFIQIHPFLNGNGRMSRLLWSALLHRFGFPPQCGIVTRPQDPYSELMRVAMTGNYAPLCEAIVESLAQAQRPAVPGAQVPFLASASPATRLTSAAAVADATPPPRSSQP